MGDEEIRFYTCVDGHAFGFNVGGVDFGCSPMDDEFTAHRVSSMPITKRLNDNDELPIWFIQQGHSFTTKQLLDTLRGMRNLFTDPEFENKNIPFRVNQEDDNAD